MDIVASYRKTFFAFSVEFFIFAATFFLALIASRAPISAVTSPSGLGASIGGFLAAFAGVSALLLLLVRTAKGAHIFSAIFALAILSGVALIGYRLGGPDVAALLFPVAALAYYALRRVAVVDLITILGVAGIAAHVGAGAAPNVIALLLVILSAYDIIAVYATGHMVLMAKTLLRSHVFFAMILPERPSGLLAPLADVEPERGFLFLGTGDLALPALLVASVGARSLPAAAFTAVGALIGLVGLHLLFVSQPDRRPMPALPPLALGTLLGYLLSFAFI